MPIIDQQVEKFLNERVVLHEKDSPLYNEHVYHIAGIITAFNVFNSIQDAGLHEQLKFKLRDRSQGYLVYGIELKKSSQTYDIYRVKKDHSEPAITKAFAKAEEAHDEAVSALWAMHDKAFFLETLKYFEKRNPLTTPLIEQLEREIIASGDATIVSIAQCLARVINTVILTRFSELHFRLD